MYRTSRRLVTFGFGVAGSSASQMFDSGSTAATWLSGTAEHFPRLRNLPRCVVSLTSQCAN
jgi:hypothetical protein